MSSAPPVAAKLNPPPQPTTQEYSIRLPKDINKKFNVMRFNGNLKIDFKEWRGKSIKMERENNMKNFKEVEEDVPKFGAGSEFGREAREEARRKKYGIANKQYKSDDQPWILKMDGKNGKKFKGIREGGVSENASYYVFTHGSSGIIEAFPLKEWYNFQPVQRYKALSAEEAEEEFSRRNKVMNFFSLMLRKRLRNDEDGGEEDLLEGEKGKKPSKKDKDFKISEMDDWIDDDEEDDSDSEKNNESGDDDKDKKKKKGALKKKKKRASDSEAFEESDDGDEEGRECDYISDSSASESELENQKEMKSVAEEDALRKLLASDEEEEEEDEDKKDDEDKNEEEDDKDKDEKDKDKGKGNDKKKDKKKKDGSDSSSDGESGAAQNKEKDDKKPIGSQNSRSATPTAAGTSSTDTSKRSANSSDMPPIKKPKLENLPSSSYISGSNESGITEDAVRRYLMRKPMTTTELLQKFKSKKTGLSSEQIVNIMTKILKNINPISQKIKGKMYFSIKPQPHQHLR